MNIAIVFFLESLLLVIISAFMFIITIISFLYQQNDFLPLLFSAIITFVVGGTFFLFLRKKFDSNKMGAREGFAVVTFGWILAAIFGGLPYIFYGHMFYEPGLITGFTDAFFESMSGFTTTGSTIMPDITIYPKAILLWRATTHWLGGMGIIVLALAVLPKLGVSGYRLFKAEVPGPIADKISPKLSDTAKYLWFVYMGITVLEVILLLFGGVDLYHAVTHAFATMATGGFSTFNESVGGFNSAYVDGVITVFMFLAGTNFALHFSFITGKFLIHLKDNEFKVYTAIIVICITLLMFWNNGVYENIWDGLRYNAFQVISIMTTTGFGTFDFELWPAQSQILLIILMFIGGCAGSTGGGIKVLRILLLFKFVKNEIYKFIYPKRVGFVRYGKTVINENIMNTIMGFFVIYIGIFITALIIVMTLIESDNQWDRIITAFAGVTATMNNIGPG
ncbi:MAG: TrkH family potassium uptake protein, partial [Spirochaetota bacterium]